MSALTHLVCSACGASHEAARLWNLSPHCGKPLLAVYDTASLRDRFTRESLVGRTKSLWRYREMLPDPGDYQPMGEGFTPLIPAARLARRFGELAIPEHGRYVGRSAMADDRGVSFIPPDVAHPMGRLVLGVGIGLLAGVAIGALMGGDHD